MFVLSQYGPLCCLFVICVFFLYFTGVIWNFLLAVTTGEINKILSGFSFLFREKIPGFLRIVLHCIKRFAILAMKSLVSDIPARDGKIDNHFHNVGGNTYSSWSCLQGVEKNNLHVVQSKLSVSWKLHSTEICANSKGPQYPYICCLPAMYSVLARLKKNSFLLILMRNDFKTIVIFHFYNCFSHKKLSCFVDFFFKKYQFF